MRLRRKPWARPELAACPFFAEDPTQIKGRWAMEYSRQGQPIHLELGCGKGGFVAELAAAHPEINYMAIDLKSEVLVLAKRKIEEAMAKAGREADNIRLMSQDIERLGMILGEEERVERVYVNFCNPWPKPGDYKHRLTHTRQLRQYRQWMAEGAQLWFKTDDPALFEDTVDYYLPQAGYQLDYLTRDLAASGFEENRTTEHEEMFMAEGKAIRFLIAQPKVDWEPPKAQSCETTEKKDAPCR